VIHGYDVLKYRYAATALFLFLYHNKSRIIPYQSKKYSLCLIKNLESSVGIVTDYELGDRDSNPTEPVWTQWREEKNLITAPNANRTRLSSP
jgi:hypothetical protein